jgi:hypothetical protein
MNHDLDIDPARAPGAFAYGLTQLRVADDGAMLQNVGSTTI